MFTKGLFTPSMILQKSIVLSVEPGLYVLPDLMKFCSRTCQKYTCKISKKSNPASDYIDFVHRPGEIATEREIENKMVDFGESASLVGTNVLDHTLQSVDSGPSGALKTP
jgi:hypothetical protein